MNDKVRATRENVTIGVVVKSRNQEVTITGEDKWGFSGFHVYKGKKREVKLFYSTLSNPHYFVELVSPAPEKKEIGIDTLERLEYFLDTLADFCPKRSLEKDILLERIKAAKNA